MQVKAEGKLGGLRADLGVALVSRDEGCSCRSMKMLRGLGTDGTPELEICKVLLVINPQPISTMHWGRAVGSLEE